MRGALSAIRRGLGFVLCAALLGALIGFVRGTRLVEANHYAGQSLTRLARWVIIDSTRDDMVGWALWAVVICLTVLLLWPVCKLILGNREQGLVGAIVAVALICVYLPAAWYILLPPSPVGMRSNSGLGLGMLPSFPGKDWWLTGISKPVAG